MATRRAKIFAQGPNVPLCKQSGRCDIGSHSRPPSLLPSSCKGTIDDIYLKLRKIQLDKQGGTVTLQRAVEQVWSESVGVLN